MNIELSIDCLPAEMICEILKNLNLNHLIQCKLVSKRWYSIVTESIKIIKLIVRNDETIKKRKVHLKEHWINTIFSRSRWYYSNEVVNSDLHFCKFNPFQLNLNRKILSNLKYLKIDETFKFDFNQLNLLTQLIHLELNCYLGADHIKLNLLELEILKINFNSSCHLTIECPKLKILYYDEHKSNSNVRLVVKYPESIRDLDSPFNGSELTQFKNVEYLKFGDNELINENTLSKLKKLKEIYSNVDVNYFFSLLDLDSDGQTKLILRNFLGMIKKLEMFDLKVFFFGLQITDHNINQIDFGLKFNEYRYVDSTYFYALNYKYLQDSLPFVDRVDYKCLVNVINPIPTDYFKKFVAITKVLADGQIDQAHFLWFLKNLKILKLLTLSFTNLNQSFYDELPTFCSLLWFDVGEEKNKKLDFNFLIQFNELRCLKLGQELSLELVKSLVYTFERLNHLEKFEFIFKKQIFKILRCSDDLNCYDIHGYIYQDKKRSKINLNELISYFEKLE